MEQGRSSHCAAQELIKYSVHFGCIFYIFIGISTHENVLADALSRPDGLHVFFSNTLGCESLFYASTGCTFARLLLAHAACGSIIGRFRRLNKSPQACAESRVGRSDRSDRQNFSVLRAVGNREWREWRVAKWYRFVMAYGYAANGSMRG